MLRVAICIPDLANGGPDRVMTNLLRGFDRGRILPLLVTRSINDDVASLIPKDVAVFLVNGRPNAYPALAVARALRRCRPDVVLATLRMIPTVLSVAHLLPRRTKIAVRPASTTSFERVALKSNSLIKHRAAFATERFLMRYADLVIAQSSSQAAELSEFSSRTRRVVRIPNPVADCPANVSSVDLPPQGDPTLVAVGRLVQLKGFDKLLRATARLSDLASLRLWILGDGPLRRELEQLASTLAISDRTHFLGHVPDPSPYVAAADLFVMCSDHEAFSNALLEAQALGVPAVACSGPANGHEIVTDGQTGLLASSNDPGVLAASIRSAVLHLPLMQRSVIASTTHDRFSLASIATKYADAFDELISVEAT